MRTLLARPREQLFTINQHAEMMKGQSNNPQIGTIEDWYIINTMAEAHPIHFHIVNFQVV